MSVTDELLENNARYADSFNGPLPLPPSRKLAVVACIGATGALAQAPHYRRSCLAPRLAAVLRRGQPGS